MQNAVIYLYTIYLAPRIPCSQLNRSFFPSYLDLSELLESPGTKKTTVQLQQQQQLSSNNTAEVVTTTTNIVHGTGSNEAGGVGSLSTSSSSKVGHSNKSKVMHDLFGLEESPLKTNILQKPKESTEDQSMASSNNSLR